jgi:hypothetical protein
MHGCGSVVYSVRPTGDDSALAWFSKEKKLVR